MRAPLPPVDTSDSERRRLRQTVYGNVFPAPIFDILPVEDPSDPGRGFLVIWIARSTSAPHAFTQGSGRHYPRRAGTEKIWLSEPDIAEAYRARFAGLADRLEQADRIETDFLNRLSRDQIFVVVTLVPDLPGMFTIDNEAHRAFAATHLNQQVRAMGFELHHFRSTRVRYRQLVASGSNEPHLPYADHACALHHEGSGAFASTVESWVNDRFDHRPERLVDNNLLVTGLAAALKTLGTHARDRAAAGGLATLRATIWPTGETAPIALVSNVGMHNERAAPAVLREQPTADAVADIDDLTTDGPALVAATHRLASGLYQAFGKAETPLVTADGAIRIGC